MIIAVIDDSREKRSEIVRVIQDAGGGSVEIREAASKVGARRLMQSETFDLAVIDIALPELDDGEPELDGGIKLLEEVIGTARFRMPKQVIGLTALEDVYEGAAAKFGGELWSVIRYDRSSYEWSEQLAAKIRHIIRIGSISNETALDYDIGIVVALKSPELDAVLDLPWSWSPAESDGDPTNYYSGQFKRLDGTFGRAILARTGQMGMPAATALTTKLGMTFRPRCIAMVGICAGNKDETTLGDVVAANPTWDYGSGKYVTRDEEEVFEPAPYPLALSTRVRGILEPFEGESDALTALRSEFKGAAPSNVPRLHMGPFASGAAVIARAAMVEEVLSQHRKLLAIDMEAYGVATAANELPLPVRDFLVLKGVSDYADEDKGESQRAYAAYMSARFLAFLCTNQRLC